MAESDPFRVRLSELPFPEPATADEGVSVEEAVERLRESPDGALVLGRSGDVTGMLTKHDLTHRLLMDPVPAGTPASRVMTAPPATVRSDATVGEAARLMAERGLCRLPVVSEGGRLEGMVSVMSLLRFIAEEFPAEALNLPPLPGENAREPEGA